MSDTPPPPPGFTEVVPAAAPPPPSTRPRGSQPSAPPPPPGFSEVVEERPTGAVHDGDTFRLNSGGNGRLYGVDAFELAQTGRSPTGGVVPLGQQARNAFVPFAQPSATVGRVGPSTYGRPVLTLENGGDAGRSMLEQGWGLATPEYLKSDPTRQRDYMEAERGARLNRRGAFGNTFQSPTTFRRGQPDPWARPEMRDTAKAGDTAVFFDEATPFQGLRPNIAAGYVAVTDDPKSTPADALAYAKANGFALDPKDVAKFYANRGRRGNNAGGVTYKDVPRVLTDPGDGKFGTTMRGVADPLNMLDEAGAVVDTLGGTNGRESLFNSDRRFGDILANNLDQNRSILANDDAMHPYYRLGGQVAGGLVLPGASIDGVGLGIARTAIRNGASRYAAEQAARAAVRNRLIVAGSVEGGAAGFGSGENWTDRGAGALIGSGVGGALGAIAGTGGQAVADAFARRAGSRSARALNPAEGSPSGAMLPEAANDPAVTPAQRALGVLNQQPGGATRTMDSPAVPSTSQALNPATANPARRALDILNLPPSSPSRVQDAAEAPVPTAAPVRPAPPPRSIEDVQSDIDAWAARNGAQPQAGADLPGVMLHGSPRADIQEFDPYGRGGYGLFGAGTYLTDSSAIAASYSKKGLSKAAQEAAADRTMYAVRQAVKNPLDMDAPADRATWEAAAKKILGDHDDGPFFEAPANATNEQLWREAEDFLSGEMVSASEGRETMDSLIRTLGHDGITHIGGGRVGKDGPRHRVVIALDPEQTEIVDRLSVGSLMNPPGPRNPDWIDIGQRQGGKDAASVERLPAYQGLADIAKRAASANRVAGESRRVDRIDVNARPAPLLGDVTDAQRAAQATRISPSDVLPIPANTVASADEAARISAGMYAQVKAPNEADALASRSIPSPKDGTKTIAKRGPLDLVTWLRSQGGIRAQGGELEHYGIDNTPRAGMDFAAGENRFGPLVSNSGMNYDEAAMRAHEAGFFPDHVERPTVDEFLDTLNGTHTGRNRAFRTDDLAEVDAYEAQRDLRHSVEGARERGAPLVEDRGQPADLADMDRNAAPVTAYEEWGENAPRMAGNLRLDKLDSPQSIKRALADTHARVGGFDAATRGRITHAETERLASELGMTADDLLKRRKGQSLNAEEALASRQILAQSSTDLVNMARRMAGMDNPGDELEAAFRQAWVRHVAIQEQVAGMTAEAGRALSAFRMTADSRALGSRVLPSLGDIAGGTARLKDIAGKIVDLEQSGVGPGGINQFSAKALLPRFRDKAVELYYNWLLSNPATHAVNVLSNSLTALGQLPEHGLAAGIGGITNVARRALGKTEVDAVLFGELGSRAVGMIQGAREGMREAARTFVTGTPRDAITKVEQQVQEAIPGTVGKIIRGPTRALAAEDEFFKAVARRSELAGLAMRTAKSEGLKGDALRRRAADLTANPSDDMLAKSFDYARYVTFQQPLGQVGQKITGITESMPILKLIVPFVRTPTNILKFAIERSPGAVVLKEWRRDIAAGGPKRDLALARVAMGTGIAATMYEMAAAGQITGGGPADESALRLLKADGWQPYSFKVGGKYYSYQRLDPYSTVIGTAADLVDQQSHMTDKQRENASFEVGAAILKNLSNKTWLSGMSSALEALNDPDRAGESFFSRTAGSIAVPAGVAQIARISDPVLREAKGPIDRIRSRIPGMSDGLMARRDVFGRAIGAGEGLGPDIMSPVWTSQAKNDPVVAALLDSGAKMSPPGKAKMSDVDYNRFQERAGAEVHQRLADLIRSPEWKRMAREDRADEVGDVVKKARKEIKRSMFGGGMPAGSGASSTYSPPPPGFTEVVPLAQAGFSEVMR